MAKVVSVMVLSTIFVTVMMSTASELAVTTSFMKLVRHKELQTCFRISVFMYSSLLDLWLGLGSGLGLVYCSGEYPMPIIKVFLN